MYVKLYCAQYNFTQLTFIKQNTLHTLTITQSWIRLIFAISLNFQSLFNNEHIILKKKHLILIKTYNSYQLIIFF